MEQHDLEPQTIQNPALIEAAKHNDVVIIADPDHADGNIRKYGITPQLAGLYAQGFHDLYLEHDPKEVSVKTLTSLDGEYNSMVKEAVKLGMNIHFYDDRTRETERDNRYPEEAKFIEKNDPYVQGDREEIIKQSPNPDKMRAYLDETQANKAADMNFRNEKMVDNLDGEINGQSSKKALVHLGRGHLDNPQDVDEGLRAKGHQTIVVEVNSAQTALTVGGEDKSDIIVAAENGKALSFKNPQTGQIVRVLEGIEIPWRNTEPVANVSPANLCTFSSPSAGCKQPKQEISR